MAAPDKMRARSFSDASDLILRFRGRENRRSITLADGAELRPGDLVVATHLWNSRLPESDAPGLAAGRVLLAGSRGSLRELASHLRADPELAGARAIYGEVGFVPDERLPQARRIVEQLGFELTPGEQPGLNPLRSAFWRNTVSWLFLKRYHPEGLRRTGLSRMRRCEVWMSVDTLFARYG